MDEEAIMFLSLCMIIVLIGFAMLSKFGGGVLSLIAAFMLVVTIAMLAVLNFADYLLVSLLFGAIGITFQPALNYKINKEQNAVVKEISGVYYATGYVSGNLFSFEFKQEQTEDDEKKMIQAPDNWERAVSNITFPFKFNVLSSGLSVQNVREELEGQRSYQEYQLSKVLSDSSGGSDVAVLEIQRKINVIQGKIERISRGEKPIGTVMYVETTAIGISEKAAVDALTRQISGLQIAMSPMNLDLQRVIGRELYTLFNINFVVPLSYEQTASYFDRQS